MCGVVGYIGEKPAAPILLEALKKLEYRGYDSAGIAVIRDHQINLRKMQGRLQLLCDATHDGLDVPGGIGIGHTRWATHGEPSDRNSHPHLSNNGRFAVVHNGIIENFKAIKEMLTGHGYHFDSDTDSEVISNLIQYFDQGDLIKTLLKATKHLEGSYALGVLSLDQPDCIAAMRKDSPLIVGKGMGENFIVSDIPAVLSLTRDVYLMEDGEAALLHREDISFYDSYGEPLKKEIFHIDWDISAAQKGGYEHFMMKEMMEQPIALQKTIHPRIREGKFDLDELSLDKDWLNRISMIHIVACGSAYHAARLGKHLFEEYLGVPVQDEVASEFRYASPLLSKDHLLIVISQSGETADTIAALREGKRRGIPTLAVVNVVGSTIAREADHVLYTWAGPEIAVATTKAYTAQIAALVLLAAFIAQETGRLQEDDRVSLVKELEALPDIARDLLEDKEQIQYLASLYFNHNDIFFMGRGIDYSLSLEGSLKLKEISYIHSEAQAAGELKHGTISLIQPGTLVIALSTQPRLRDKMASNIQEVRARGAKVLVLVSGDGGQMVSIADELILLPQVSWALQPIIAILPLQLFAYYVAALRGNDVDKPRNLAKSVTVE